MNCYNGYKNGYNGYKKQHGDNREHFVNKLIFNAMREIYKNTVLY